MKTPPVIKLTGHFDKTFSVKEAKSIWRVGFPIPCPTSTIEWDFNKKKTSLTLSNREAKELAETFEKLGFTQIQPKHASKASRDQVVFESSLDTMMEEFRSEFPSCSSFDEMHKTWNENVKPELSTKYSNL